MSNLEILIKNKKATVSVIGAGYVGLPMAVEIAKAGFKTFILDISKDKVDSINSGESYILDVKSKELNELVKLGKIRANTFFDEKIDIFVICVPTLLDESNDPDPKHILAAAENIIASNKYNKETLIILESTVYPGFTRDVLQKALSTLNFNNIDSKSYLAFSPERIDPNNKTYTIKNTPKLVGGINKDSTEMAFLFYNNVVDHAIKVNSCEVAEMTKIYENIYRFININYVNEMAVLCEKMGISIWDVIQAASTKPFGFTKFTPSPGIGGACIPINPYYLKYKLRSMGLRSKMIDVCEEINKEMPRHIVELTSRTLNKCKLSINGSKIIVFGVSYKPNIDDVRESPSITIIEELLSMGAEVVYYDPYVEKFKLNCGEDFCCTTVEKCVSEEFDCAIIMTHHDDMNYDLINTKTIVDTKNIIKKNNFCKVLTIL